MVLVIGGCEHTASQQGARSASNLLRRRIEHEGAMCQHGERVELAVNAPAYLDVGEMGEPGRQRRMLGRALQSTCSGHWWRVQLASYLGLQCQATHRFCAHVAAAAGSSGEKKQRQKVSRWTKCTRTWW